LDENEGAVPDPEVDLRTLAPIPSQRPLPWHQCAHSLNRLCWSRLYVVSTARQPAPDRTPLRRRAHRDPLRHGLGALTRPSRPVAFPTLARGFVHPLASPRRGLCISTRSLARGMREQSPMS